MWYKRAERQYRIALFFSAASLAGAFGGVLAYGISFMNDIGGYQGWVRHLSGEVVQDTSTDEFVHSDGFSSSRACWYV
jgi:hypothetical protein